jgi:HEAT repeat
MKSKKKAIGILLIMLTAAITHANAQTSEIENLFRNFEARAEAGTPGTVDEAEPVLDRFTQGSRESVAGALPMILHAASDPHLSVRRVAAMALYEITTRPDGRALLSTEIATFTSLLTDTDIPIRRISILAVHNLRLNASSPLVPVLETYLAREDAVSTIGAGVATALMEAAPNNAESIDAVVQYMRRKDQTPESRYILLDAIRYAKSNNRKIGKEVVAYADDSNEETSAHAIETLQNMGKSVILDSQQSLSRIAGDSSRAPGVRTAATQALSAVQ